MEVFGNVEERVKQLWKDLCNLEMTKESCGLMEEEKLELERVQGELEKLLFWKKFVGGRNIESFILEETRILNSFIV